MLKDVKDIQKVLVQKTADCLFMKTNKKIVRLNFQENYEITSLYVEKLVTLWPTRARHSINRPEIFSLNVKFPKKILYPCFP
jgi:hypothetical protein